MIYMISKLLKASLLALCLVSGVSYAHGGDGWHGGGGDWHGGGGVWHGGGGGWHAGGGGFYGRGGGWYGGGGGYWGPHVIITAPVAPIAPVPCDTVQICDNYNGHCWLERRCY